MSDPATSFDNLTILAGRHFPRGAKATSEGIQFTIISRHATRVSLAFFRGEVDTEPVREIELDSNKHRFADSWSVIVQGLPEQFCYAYRLDGPVEPKKGHRFDSDVYLLDPYATRIVGSVPSGTGRCAFDRSLTPFQGAPRPAIPLRDTVIYETHVRGLTRHASSGVAHPGTYHGLVEKLPYLKDLGVTSIELLPVHESGEDGLGRCSIATRKELTNYWGYSTIAFFAPMARYACDGSDSDPVREFQNMTAAVHEAGMEVILDVVYNHTSENGGGGPLLSFRGIDNILYYLLDEDGHYLNHSGCGNTVRCGHPVVQDLVLDSLRYWVTVMGVDGFRFDLASILNRGSGGALHTCAPLVERIAEDPLLRNVKLIAEPWDVGGGYQVGAFGNGRWSEWNDQFRDHVRRYWLGHDGFKGRFASRITGSADIYQWAGRQPQSSINFVTCHDGFTMRDLVSYNGKHNLANGEDNRDGSSHNHSWNFGVEGDTDDAEILRLRMQMQKSFLATLFLSQGVPMLLGGDEFGRTQHGNNNAYCQDNEISWYDWTLLECYGELHRFCKGMIQFRKEHPVFRRTDYFRGAGAKAEREEPDLLWFDVSGQPEEWGDADLKLACWINGAENGGTDLYVMFNPTLTMTRFYVPRGSWLKRIDTAAITPNDIVPAAQALPTGRSPVIKVAAKSLVVLSGRY